MKSEVYFNLHKNTFSLRSKGKVYDYQDSVLISNAKFVVREGGRQRVLKESKKNVHAFVKGDVICTDVLPQEELDKHYIKAYYNPYRCKTFICLSSGSSLFEARLVYLRASDKSIWYWRRDG